MIYSKKNIILVYLFFSNILVYLDLWFITTNKNFSLLYYIRPILSQ